MADLNYADKRIIEKFLGMGSGYVLDFSNRTFEEFVYDSVGINIYENKYDFESGSKANRLRAFLKLESNHRVGVLIDAFCEYWNSQVGLYSSTFDSADQHLCDKCKQIAIRLKQDSVIDEIEVIKEDVNDKDITLLAKSIRESIEKNEPEVALDRLHTYCMKFFRNLCDKHQIEYGSGESLNAIFGKYVKYIVSTEYVESSMTEKILKYSINIIEAFNDVRNNKSLAHDNALLNYNESLLIFNNVTNSIKFILTIEERIDAELQSEDADDDWEELPF
ncbi:MAG: abortive infection family protein [bacterium]|nr:abortive infection family protein [bacterium]